MNNKENLVASDGAQLPPTIFVIFGATGDLFGRKLLPALFDLYTKKLLPTRFKIIASARRPFTDEEFRAMMTAALEKKGRKADGQTAEFLAKLSYHQGLFEDTAAYKTLGEKLTTTDDEFGQCSNKLFYLAVPPANYQTIIEHLSESGLTIPCDDELGWTRVLIEKPFGKDAAAAEKLDITLAKLFKEEQIFRIDHYLAKETIQNIITFRFANSFFEPLWNNEHIDSVSINLFEKDGINGRGALYEGLGALRDVGQNHSLSMLALIAMDEPKDFGSAAIRKNRATILKKLKKMKSQELANSVRLGQYEGYLKEAGVAPDSKTETYFSIKVELDSPRWRGVPFYLTSGKALAESKTEILVCFKDSDDSKTTPDAGAVKSRHNLLKFRIQPDEGISISFFVKKPGFSGELQEKELSFSYTEANSAKSPDAYERVLLDAIKGDQTLFASTEEIEASWKFISPILENWKEIPLEVYKKGIEASQI